MQIPLKQISCADKGYALIIIMIFLAVTLLVLGSLMSWTSSSSKQVARNNQFLASEDAADAATELVLATMQRDYLSQTLNSSNSYTSLIPVETNWPANCQYTFSSSLGPNTTYVSISTNTTYLVPLTSSYKNLQGYEDDCTIISTASNISQTYSVSATVTNLVQFDNVPIFQFAIFYNLDMEIDPGQPMVVKGPVFCNANIWDDSSDLTFLSSVAAVGNIYTNDDVDPFSDNYTGTTGTPIFDGPVKPAQNALTMPIGGTNNSAAAVQNILNLPPPGLGAPNPAYLAASNQNYMFNQSDLIISNSTYGINGSNAYSSDVTVYYQNPNISGYLNRITNDVVQIITNVISGTNVYKTNLFYSFVTNVTFFDFRESDTVQALQIDIGKLDTWLTNTAPGGGSTWELDNTTGSTSKGHAIDSIYVYNSVPMNSSTLAAVRLANGQQLPYYYSGTVGYPDGLTVATPMPLYTLGNYNVQTNSGGAVLGTNDTSQTYPAALMGDAFTILSTNWSDVNSLAYSSNYSPTTAPARTPGDTTVNAAALCGIVQTVPTISGNYSGGTENFIRLLEDWNNNIASWGTKSTLTYNGSIVVMFYSQYATNYWGGYYTVPKRNWSFDQNFANGKLPPLTPQTKAVLRTVGGWGAN
ncbi:MAG: hypothetical protein ABSG87_00325 [Verrucomicrobiota bacterium]|jgi:Tfp pilus assembly protein PilX